MIQRIGLILFCLIGIVLFSNTVFAISDSFVISQQIGNDTTPPTTPNPVDATPIASTQIDITWGASTDDQNLTGYRLFRDTVQIATTTLTTYSDTGLTASTTYSYTVQAYDWFLNISTTSVASATTTLQAPSITASSTDNSTAGTRFQVRLFDINISTDQTSAEITWETNQYAQYSLRWGKVSSYDLGFVNNDSFRKSHRTVISDLEPGSTYVYELLAYNQRGVEFVLSRDTFTTKQSPDNIAPSNVSNLYATVEGNSIVLNWSNPPDTDFHKVRIVRNYNFYPTDTSNGFIAYEGKLNSFYDANALKVYPGQYYTIFSYDDSGNISSGAVIHVKKNNTAASVDEKKAPETSSTTSQPIVATTGESKETPELNVGDSKSSIMIDFSDVLFSQNDVQITSQFNSVSVVKNTPVLLKIPYDLLPEHLKTIVVTVQGTESKPVSYILRVNKDKSAYEALLPSFENSTEYLLEFSIYDYRTELLTMFDGQLRIIDVAIIPPLKNDIFGAGIPAGLISFSFLILFALLLYILVLRRKMNQVVVE